MYSLCFDGSQLLSTLNYSQEKKFRGKKFSEEKGSFFHKDFNVYFSKKISVKNYILL